MSLNIEILGRGEPVVFLHGFLESNKMWSYLNVIDFPCTSILVDLPGHGASSFLKNYSSLAEIAEEIYYQLQEKGYDTFHIIGHSLGGYIAIELHKLLKTKQKLILYHSNFWEDSPEKKIDRTRVSHLVKEDLSTFVQIAIPNLFQEAYRKSEVVLELIVDAKQMNPNVVCVYSELMRDRPDNSDYIISQNNVYFIQGKFDSIVPINQSFIQFTKNINYYEIDAGHMSYVENQVVAKKSLKKTLHLQPIL